MDPFSGETPRDIRVAAPESSGELAQGRLPCVLRKMVQRVVFSIFLEIQSIENSQIDHTICENHICELNTS